MIKNKIGDGKVESEVESIYSGWEMKVKDAKKMENIFAS